MSDVELARRYKTLITDDAFKTNSKRGIINIALAIGMAEELPSQMNVVVGNAMGHIHAVYWEYEDDAQIEKYVRGFGLENYLCGLIQGARFALKYTGVINDDN